MQLLTLLQQLQQGSLFLLCPRTEICIALWTHFRVSGQSSLLISMDAIGEKKGSEPIALLNTILSPSSQ